MNLADHIDDVYVSLENAEYINFHNIKEGREFVLYLTCDFLKCKKLVNNLNIPIDDRNYVDNNAFPVTVEILNRDETPGEEVHIKKGHKNFILIYYGISPELENFVNIILWPKSKSSNVAYTIIYDMVMKDKDQKKAIQFKTKYGLELPNTIHPANDNEIVSFEKKYQVYDWKYVPYLKDTGDTILSHTSPLNFRKVYLDERTEVKTYINIKITTGKIVEFLGKNVVRLQLPSFYQKTFLDYRATINTKSNFELQKGSLGYFMIMEKIDDNVKDIIQIVNPASPIDIIGHMISFSLYSLHLYKKRLMIVSFSQYEQLYSKCLEIIHNFYEKDTIYHFKSCSPELVFSKYLSPFFKLINNNLFFIPNNQFNSSDIIFQLYDNGLSMNKTSLINGRKILFDEKGKRIDLSKYDKIYRFVRFITHLNYLLFWNDERTNFCRRLLEDLS